jgi:hypothetical protein
MRSIALALATVAAVSMVAPLSTGPARAQSTQLAQADIDVRIGPRARERGVIIEEREHRRPGVVIEERERRRPGVVIEERERRRPGVVIEEESVGRRDRY